MRKRYSITLLVLFLLVNGFIVYWVWDRFTDPGQAEPESPAETQRAVSEEFGKTDSLAYDLIAKWNREPVVDLSSADLRSSIEALPEANCIGLPSGAIPLDSASLPRSMKQDLDTAVTGLLRAYKECTIDALINYMKERGQTVDPKSRKAREKRLVKQGVPDPEKLNDEDLFRTALAKSSFNADTHWSGVVVESSCRQFWNGKNVPLKRLQFFDVNSALQPDAAPGQLEQAAYLTRLFRGNSRPGTNFASQTGSLQESHKDDPQVLLCDVQLVIELDDMYSRAKAAYLFRFWFNARQDKWQPRSLMGFASDPQKLFLPDLAF